MDKMHHVSSPVRRSSRLVSAKKNSERSPIKFVTSAEAITVSDSDSSADENVRKRARYEEVSDLDSGSDEDNVDIDDDEDTDANDELVCPKGKKKGGSILFLNMRTRSTCNILKSAISQLTSDQRLAVAAMGLEGVLGLEITRIPSKIARFAVNSFDHKKLKIVTESGRINVTEGDVREILGLPLGGRIFRDKDKCVMSDLVKKWRSCFSSKQVKCSEILREMGKLVDGGELFKLHFLVLFYSSIVMSIGNQYCNQRILNCIDSVDDIRSLNWCENVVYSAVRSKEIWLEANKRSPYTGPMLFLTVLYITRFEDLRGKFDIMWPAIRGMTNSRLRNRQKAEIKRGGFGKCLRIVKYDGSPKISKHSMNQGTNNAEASTSRQQQNNAENEAPNDAEASTSKAIFNLLKEAVKKLASAKGMWDSATDEKRNDKQLCEVVREIHSKVGQFMVYYDGKTQPMDPMDFEGPSFSFGLTQPMEKGNGTGDNIQMEGDGMESSSGGAVDDIISREHPCTTTERWKEQTGKSHVFSAVFDESPVPVEEWTDPRGKTPVFATMHSSPTVEKRTESRGNGPKHAPVCNPDVIRENIQSPPVHANKWTAPQGKSVAIALPAQNIHTPQSVPFAGLPKRNLVSRYEDSHIKEHCSGGQEKSLFETPGARTDGSSRQGHVSDYGAGPSFVPASWVVPDDTACTNFSPIQPLHERDDAFVIPDLPILEVNNESDLRDIVQYNGSSEALPVNVCRAVRQKKPGEALKSPFVDRITNIKEKISQCETILCNYVFEYDGDDNEILFKWGDVEGTKSALVSLCDGFEIKSSVLDIWSCILNKKEELRANKDFLRFFCTTSTTLVSSRKYYSIERQQQLFENALDICLARFPEVQMSKISMLSFPVYNDKHYILVCVDFKRTAIHVLDNQAFTNQADVIYSKPVQNLLLNLGAYLRKKSHYYAYIFPKIQPVLHELPWATTKANNSDVVFVMRHMETYFGGAVKLCKCGLRKEGNAQIAQLNLLRKRYLNEIIRSVHNTVRSEVMRKSASYRLHELEGIRDSTS